MEKVILSTEPLVYYVDGILDKEECEHLIEISKNKLQQALVSGEKTGFKSSGRTGKNCWIPHNTSETSLNIALKISNLVDKPLENAESFQVIHYSKNQKYEYHYDAFPLDKSEKAKRCLKNGGQRILTALIYLNDVEKGGETGFKNLKVEVKPKMGRIVVFENTKKDSLEKHLDSLHSGRPVIEGEKYAINLWFRHLPKNQVFDIEKYLQEEKPKNIQRIESKNIENKDINKSTNYLEVGDFIPFVKVNGKELHNIVDNKRMLFINSDLNFNINLKNFYNSHHIFNCKNTVLENLLEKVNSKFTVYYVDSNRRILDIYHIDNLSELKLNDTLSFNYRVPYLEINNVLSDELLQKLVNHYNNSKKTLHSSSGKNRYHVHPDKELERELDNKLSRSLFPEIRKIYNLPVNYRELYKIASYDSESNGRFHPHRDTPYPYQHRKLGLLIFLNDDYEGGELELVEYNLKLKPKKNTAIIFPGISTHKVHNVTKGNRMNIISFICEEIEGKTKNNPTYMVKSDFYKENNLTFSKIYPF